MTRELKRLRTELVGLARLSVVQNPAVLTAERAAKLLGESRARLERRIRLGEISIAKWKGTTYVLGRELALKVPAPKRRRSRA